MMVKTVADLRLLLVGLADTTPVMAIAEAGQVNRWPVSIEVTTIELVGDRADGLRSIVLYIDLDE